MIGGQVGIVGHLTIADGVKIAAQSGIGSRIKVEGSIVQGSPAYNIGDYNVYIISKDALEPVVLSLKKIEEYEFADKLSPEERDNVCRIIGKFAHTTKRRIQVDEFFAREFLDTLSKAGTQLPRDILENVIKFENAEKLNPPMEKRNKKILTKDLKQQVDKLEKEMEVREIPKISPQTDFDL